MTTFSKRPTKYRLVWTAPNGELASAFFRTWAELEAFSKRCLERGLKPWIPLDVPTPYDKG